MRKLLFFLLIILISCDNAVLPKPKGYLSLAYPAPNYTNLALERPYTFKTSDATIIEDLPNNWLKIKYPKLKASIDITYRKVDNNLEELLLEAEKLVYKHTQKADQIKAKDFENVNANVFGTIHDITGNAASQIQFHLTDSTNHFIKGALYFYAKPNYDSILPAVNYIKKDIQELMETARWTGDINDGL